MNRTSTSSVTPHRAYGSIPQPNLLWPWVLPHLFLGKRTVEAGALGTDRKQHIYFVPTDRTRLKKQNSGSPVASETSLSDLEASSSGSSKIMLGSAGSSLSSENKTKTKQICFNDISNQTEIDVEDTIIHINFCRQEGRGSYRLTNASKVACLLSI